MVIKGEQKNYNTIVMFAEDTGITSFYQLIESISLFKHDLTKLVLFYNLRNLVSG